MDDFYVSRRGHLRMRVQGPELVACLEPLDPDWNKRVSPSLSEDQQAAIDGLPVVALDAEDLAADPIMLFANRPTGEPMKPGQKFTHREAVALVVGLCELAERLHRQQMFLGPPDDQLVFVSDRLLMIAPALVGHVHRYEVGLRGATMTMGYFKTAPELVNNTPTADVFFLTQFLFELVVGREPFPNRRKDYFTYLEMLREGPKLPSGLDPMIYWRGMAPNPADRFESPRFLADALR